MRYRTGLYGGSFDPLHTGHVNCIIEAASLCDDLYLVLSFSRNRDSIPVEIRYRWLTGAFRHMDNVHVILLEDTEKTKSDYDTGENWEKGRDTVLSAVGRPIDVVFCGSDYAGTERYEKLYGCKVIYFDRSVIPVSSTEIRKAPLCNWRYIPEICRPYFTKKVLLVGAESTGKSTLAKNLALAYGTNYLEEVGRDVCFDAGGEDMMVEADFHEILVRHKTREYECLRRSSRILFVDTDAVTTLWFSRFLLRDERQVRRTEALADAINAVSSYDLILFSEPSVPFVQDGTRNERIAAERKECSEQIKELFRARGMSLVPLDGDYAERFAAAKKTINETFNIKEVMS